MGSTTDALGARSKLRNSFDRSFQKICLLFPTTSKPAKRGNVKPTEHQTSLFDALEIQFVEIAENATSPFRKKGEISISFRKVKAFRFKKKKIPAKDVRPLMPTSNIQNLPISILTRILGHLLVSDRPVVLEAKGLYPNNHCSHLRPEVLVSCRLFYHVGMPLLYGSNTITTSTPTSSKDFDKHLLKLPGRYRQLIQHVRLQVDWGDELWAKFPLIARVLGEIVGLKSLEIRILGPLQRQGPSAVAMLKAEEKCLADLVLGDLKALKVFKLEGFSNKAFTKTLETYISSGRRSLAWV